MLENSHESWTINSTNMRIGLRARWCSSRAERTALVGRRPCGALSMGALYVFQGLCSLAELRRAKILIGDLDSKGAEEVSSSITSSGGYVSCTHAQPHV
jgi:hypothetical protein